MRVPIAIFAFALTACSSSSSGLSAATVQSDCHTIVQDICQRRVACLVAGETLTRCEASFGLCADASTVSGPGNVVACENLINSQTCAQVREGVLPGEDCDLNYR